MKSPCVQVGRCPALGLPGAADLGEEAEHVGRGGGGRLERLLAQPQVSWRPAHQLWYIVPNTTVSLVCAS